MDIKDSVRKYFKLEMPGETNGKSPSATELLKLWEEFSRDSSDIGHEFSNHLPSLKGTQKISVVKKIIKICQDLHLYANESIDYTKEVINSMTHLDELEQGPDAFVGKIFSIFTGINTVKSKIKSMRVNEIKRFEKIGNKFKIKYNKLNSEYFNVCYEAERVFFKTFKGNPIN